MTDSGWTVEFANAAAEAETMALPADMLAALRRQVVLIEALGMERLRAPHAKAMGDGLWELRFGGRDGIARSIYVTAKTRRVVILATFVKKSQKTPQAMLRLARQRLQAVN